MPIITSLLDTDFYKFTMGQWVCKRYPNVPVRYAFTNRTARVPLAAYIDETALRQELDHVRTLRVSDSEVHYLRSLKAYGEDLFGAAYLQFLQKLCLPPYELERQGDTYRLEFAGPWSTTIYWETLALSIINELYYRAVLERDSAFPPDLVYATGKQRLADKINILRRRPEIMVSDFGTRRRFSHDWHASLTGVMAEALPRQFLGTSNVALAMRHNLLPIGTLAHELYMVMSGVMHDSDASIQASHNQVLQEWWAEYGWDLSIALTDTYGTDFFFRDMGAEQAHQWKGLRQDSGDPLAFGENAIAFYHRHGIDPRDKLLVFSDGLDVETICKLSDHFADRIRLSFGWGTNLTNDLGPGALSLVVKVVEANGHGTVKLSDNLAKATGAPEDVARFKRIFGHTVTTFEACTY